MFLPGLLLGFFFKCDIFNFHETVKIHIPIKLLSLEQKSSIGKIAEQLDALKNQTEFIINYLLSPLFNELQRCSNGDS